MNVRYTTVPMDLFLIPNNPLQTVLASPNGVAHYQISTTKRNSRKTSRIWRPAETEADSVVAEIHWRHIDLPTIIRFGGAGETGVLSSVFLYKRTQFSSARRFIGNDNLEYQWKFINGIGFQLTRTSTKLEVARYNNILTTEGLFAGERKAKLTILEPVSSLDIDLIVLSFIIMEKKRRDRAGDNSHLTLHDEDPQGDGCGDGCE